MRTLQGSAKRTHGLQTDSMAKSLTDPTPQGTMHSKTLLPNGPSGAHGTTIAMVQHTGDYPSCGNLRVKDSVPDYMSLDTTIAWPLVLSCLL